MYFHDIHHKSVNKVYVHCATVTISAMDKYGIEDRM